MSAEDARGRARSVKSAPKRGSMGRARARPAARRSFRLRRAGGRAALADAEPPRHCSEAITGAFVPADACTTADPRRAHLRAGGDHQHHGDSHGSRGIRSFRTRGVRKWDGIKQTVTQFTHERVPIASGVLLDISDSISASAWDARAANRFCSSCSIPLTNSFVAFNHRARLTGWTRADGRRACARALRPTGGTAIYDAIVESLPMLERRTRQRAALLVISTAPTLPATRRCARCAALLRSAFVYAIAIDSARPPADQHAVNAALREIT